MRAFGRLVLVPLLLVELADPSQAQFARGARQSDRPEFAGQWAQSVKQACPQPALSRFVRHRVAAGETIDSIAQKYNLIPATLMGLNPSLRGGQAAGGTEILVPPFNGIRVDVKPGQTWREVAKTYGVRPDVLFEVNGCQPNPKVVFVPGVNWSPNNASGTRSPVAAQSVISHYPLPGQASPAAVLLGYGWRLQPATGQVAFHSGLDLAAAVGTPVLAAGDGTVAFADSQGVYGNLVVINHREGLQTRYAQLGRLSVKSGQTVVRGQAIGTVGTSGSPSSTAPHLHFEVRSRSNLGWVAEDAEVYLLKPAVRQAQP